MRPTVLSIEDEPDIGTLIEHHLTKEGCDVILAQSGAEALAVLDNCRPDLILLDLMLPDIDGFGICEILRSKPETATIPIILVTAWASVEARHVGLDLGAFDYITKPFSPKQMVARVNRVLALRRPADTV